MYLLIDAGNTRLKFACHDGREWLLRDSLLSPEELPGKLPTGFQPSRILVSCVAGEEFAEHLRQALTCFDAPLEFLRSSAQRCGVLNRYHAPASLGTDRWASAIGAWHRQRTDCLLICAGTATTIDIVRAPGEFSGGCILPGLSLMLDSLAQRTAALPRAAADISPAELAEIPRDTLAAIAAGCLHAQLGAIERMRTQLTADAPVLVAGGNAELLIPHLAGYVHHTPWLVMEGLLIIAQTALLEDRFHENS
jgi:type III pantothenate kinase